MSEEYQNPGPTREAVDAMSGAVVLEFGTGWCGYCQGAQSSIRAAFADATGIEHIKVEDGPGRPLGRTFKVKLWPTLIGMKDGVEVARVVRPERADEVRELLSALQ